MDIYVLKLTLFSHVVHYINVTLVVRLVLGRGSLLRVMMFICAQCGSVILFLAKQQKSNLIHVDICCSLLALIYAVHSHS